MLLSASGLRSPTLRGVGIDLRKGEIFGLGGLVGQGQGSLLEALFGVGTRSTRDRSPSHPHRPALSISTPRRAIKAGFAYVPQERKTEGLLIAERRGVQHDVGHPPPAAHDLRRHPSLFSNGDLVSEARSLARKSVPLQAPPSRSAGLSGGNQQKVLIGEC